jgi:hypothetical protein
MCGMIGVNTVQLCIPESYGGSIVLLLFIVWPLVTLSSSCLLVSPSIAPHTAHTAHSCTGGMFVMITEKLDKLPSIFGSVNPESRFKDFGFCGIEDDQEFGADDVLRSPS